MVNQPKKNKIKPKISNPERPCILPENANMAMINIKIKNPLFIFYYIPPCLF